MRLQAADIVLGDERWTVRPLTLAQVQAIEPLVIGSADAKAGSIGAAIAILRIALTRDHSPAAERLEAVEASAPEIAAAMAQVLRLGGFLPIGDPTPGEVDAGAPPASSGAGSTRG